LTMNDAAEHLGLSLRTVRNIIEQGDLVVHKFNSRIKIHPKDLDDYIDRARSDR
jgi:excisionase family DNA binding protein